MMSIIRAKGGCRGRFGPGPLAQLAVLSLKRFVHDLISAIIKPLHAATFADMDHDHGLTPNVALIAPLPEGHTLQLFPHPLFPAKNARTHPSPATSILA